MRLWVHTVLYIIFFGGFYLYIMPLLACKPCPNACFSCGLKLWKGNVKMIQSPLSVGQFTILRLFELISSNLAWHIKWPWNAISVNLWQLEVFILPLDITLVVFWLKSFGWDLWGLWCVITTLCCCFGISHQTIFQRLYRGIIVKGRAHFSLICSRTGSSAVKSLFWIIVIISGCFVSLSSLELMLLSSILVHLKPNLLAPLDALKCETFKHLSACKDGGTCTIAFEVQKTFCAISVEGELRSVLSVVQTSSFWKSPTRKIWLVYL